MARRVTERNQRIKQLRDKGVSVTAIAVRFGLSKFTVYQILGGWGGYAPPKPPCPTCGREMRA